MIGDSLSHSDFVEKQRLKTTPTIFYEISIISEKWKECRNLLADLSSKERRRVGA